MIMMVDTTKLVYIDFISKIKSEQFTNYIIIKFPFRGINLTNKKGIIFDRKYELVQDNRDIYPLSFDQIIDKNCYIRFTNVENDTELNGVKTFKYKEIYFCRYQICDYDGNLKPIKQSIECKNSSPKTPRSIKEKSQTPNKLKNGGVLSDVKQIQKKLVSPIKIVNNSVKKVTRLKSHDIAAILSDNDDLDENDENTEDEVSPSKRKKITDDMKLISTLNHSACRNLMDSLNDASIGGDDLNTTQYAVVKTPKKTETDIVLTLRKTRKR